MIDTLTPPPVMATDRAADLATLPRDQNIAAAPVFNGLLDRAYSEGQSEEAQLREAAEKLVATTMIMPLFEQLRSDPLAANLVHGGRAEKIFQQQMDQILSDRIASATKFDVVDAVYNQLSQAMKGGGLNTNA